MKFLHKKIYLEIKFMINYKKLQVIILFLVNIGNFNDKTS